MATDAGFAEGGHDIHTEEWHPADEEHAHYDADRYRCLVVGHVVGRGVVQVADFEFLLGTRPSNAAISVLLFFGDFSGPRYGSY